ncbi:MAG TPA: DUF547 domain-containing protein [Tepidisphaeraceae bacterium]|jgi:hypothetical protein
MVKFISLLSLMSLAVGCASSVPDAFKPKEPISAFSNADWNKVLRVAVTPDGYVRHDDVKANKDGAYDALQRYVGQIGEASPKNRPDLFATDADKLAYWLNAYNAICLYAVQKKNLPSNVLYSSIPPGLIFISDSTRVGGEGMTLDNIERKYARSFNDPRIHFALNCMSTSCPPLRAEAFEGDRLEQQLSDQARLSLDEPRVVKKISDDEVAFNNIFTDYWKSDFVTYAKNKLGKADGTPLDACKSWAGPNSPVRTATKFSSQGYDWSLNRPRR